MRSEQHEKHLARQSQKRSCSPFAVAGSLGSCHIGEGCKAIVVPSAVKLTYS